MGRVKIELPESFRFSCEIPVRITDINYGGHTGNDTLLSLIHEIRMQFLCSIGYTEMDMAGAGLIMADAAIEFRKELFYGESLTAFVSAGDFSRIGFDLYYKLEKKTETGTAIVALAKTGMVCYDYSRKKIIAVPDEARQKLESA